MYSRTFVAGNAPELPARFRGQMYGNTFFICKRFTKYFCTCVHFQNCHTFVRMKKQLTPVEAFHDFLIWVKVSGHWQSLTKQERNKVITARRDMEGKRAKLGEKRIKNILDTFAPGRYTWSVQVEINEP